MYSFINADHHWGFRLRKTNRIEFIKVNVSLPFILQVVTKKDYVLIPEKLLIANKTLTICLTRSHNFVHTLKTK